MESAGTRHDCTLCDKTYLSKGALLKHCHKKHPDQTTTKRSHTKLSCPMVDCNIFFQQFNSLREHLITEHMQQLEEQNLQFQTMQDFLNWKSEEEKNTLSTFTQRNADGVHLATGQTRYYYVCHRSHLNKRPLLEEEILKRSRKFIGSCKIDRTCPSTITATVASTVEVTYHPIHIGHALQIKHQRLPESTRMEIAGKLGVGIAPKRIIDDIRECATPGTSVQRTHLIVKQDVCNIQRSFNISYPTRLHEDDASSVQLWVQKMMTLEDCPVIYYKEKGQPLNGFRVEDFFLIIMSQFQRESILEFGDKICVDGTHGLNNYGIQMFTILVVDSYGAGIPVAFCFSDREDTNTFVLFFSKVKEVVGLITPTVFMSDDAPAFYNAWEQVMGPVDNRLLCSWHVLRSWSSNLSKIKGTADEKKEIFNSLKNILKQTEEMEFYNHINILLNRLMSDPDTSSFADYILKNYCHRVRVWAYCFRVRLGINTNMYLESLHKKIKYTYLEGKSCKRLDKTIYCLVTLLKDICFDNLIKNAKNVPTTKILSARKNHKIALEKNSAVQLIEANKWSVASTQANLKYIVEKIENTIACPCNIICDMCKICIHSYQCECIENSIRHNICQHIHIVCRNDLTKENRKIVTEKLPLLIPTSINMNDTGDINDTKFRNFQATCNVLKGFEKSIVTIGNQHYDDAMLLLSKAIKIIDSNTTKKLTSVEDVKTSSNIEPQIRFQSKKRKKNTT